MSGAIPSRIPPTRRPLAVLVLAAVCLAAGVVSGLNLARWLQPVPSESRSLMELMAIQHSALEAAARRGRCDVIAPTRLQFLDDLGRSIPLTLQDTMALDKAFFDHAEALRQAFSRLAGTGTPHEPDCGTRMQALGAVREVCDDCHRDYRVGG